MVEAHDEITAMNSDQKSRTKNDKQQPPSNDAAYAGCKTHAATAAEAGGQNAVFWELGRDVELVVLTIFIPQQVMANMHINKSSAESIDMSASLEINGTTNSNHVALILLLAEMPAQVATKPQILPDTAYGPLPCCWP